MSFESREKLLTDEEWYDTARAKVNSFINELDPHLRAEVGPATVTNDKKVYDTLALSFTSDEDPNLKWTMEIGKDSDYIENKLESVVRKIYSKRKSGN